MTDTPRNWRSCIHSWVVFHGKQLRLLPQNETTWSKLPKPALDVIAPLVDELVEATSKASDAEHLRTARAIERIINRRIWNALTPFSSVKLGAYQQLDFDPYATPQSTRKWCADLDNVISTPAAPIAASQRRKHTG